MKRKGQAIYIDRVCYKIHAAIYLTIFINHEKDWIFFVVSSKCF